MSFENPIINTSNEKPWARAFRWKGGVSEDVTLPDGTQAKKVKAAITSYNSETQETDEFPAEMKIAVVGVTTQVGGGIFDRNAPANNASFYSNEVVNSFEQPFNVYKRTFATKQTEKYAEKKFWSEIKPNKPQGMQLQINLYFYNFKTKAVDRLELLGCSRNSWFTAKLNNAHLYEGWLTLKPGEKQINGTSEFIAPIFAMGENYTNDERKEIVNAESYKNYAEWEKRLATNMERVDGVDQTPAQYAGEENQEVVDTDEPINLDDLPF